MKKPIKIMIIAFIFVVSMISCNNEEIFVEEIVEVVDETPLDDETSNEETTAPEEDENIDLSTTPCNFTLDNIQANGTIIIDCILDLQGQTINLPDNVTIVHDGGDIINGTLNFSGGTIDGEFLSGNLTIGGSSKPQIKDTSFSFDPKRWGIVEGKVSDEVALQNKLIFQKSIDLVKQLGTNIFKVDNMDAYFKVGIYGTPRDLANDAIHIPSDFHLKMTENTFLRVQPNDLPFSILLAAYEQNNVQISGGNLVGDRWAHDYKIIINGTIDRSNHEWPVLLQFAGVTNSVVDGVYMTDSTGDALVLGNTNGYRFNAGTKFNKDVLVKNCTMNESRRNNISVTDGMDLIIENCTITKAGIGQQPQDIPGQNKQYNSNGVLPRAGIDVEPFIGGEDDNNLVYYARVERLTIKGCTFKENANGSIIDYAGEDVVVDGNFSDSGFSTNHGWRTKYINNTLTATVARNIAGVGISTGYSNVNYEIKNNTVTGFRVGLQTNKGTGVVSGNTIKDFNVGIENIVGDSFIIENNTIDGTDGVGISSYAAKGNYTYRNNTITVDKSPMNWNSVISTNSVFEGNKFIARNKGGYVWIKDSQNVTLRNNTVTNATILEAGSTNFFNINNIVN